ncbi:MAG: Mur ligase domain-containing protein [Kiritimatiellales bacterium]|jgi:UDP-N-acetylmuramate--alanine ligase
MNSKKIHIIGIGGTGMNGVAQLAAHAGYQVSGSDRACSQPNCIVGQASLYPESLCSSNDQNNTRSRIREARPTTPVADIFQTLQNMGITLFPQDGSGITADTAAVVYSTAIESDNPDIQKAKSLDIPLLHRADMLAKLCEGKEVIAVAGTAGKSTVTGLLGWIFQCLDKDPTVYCGAPVLNWKGGTRRPGAFKACPEGPLHLGNVRYGTGPWIIEADESDRSFLKFHPHHAIITNIAEDHFSLAELHRLFAQFESQVSGTVIKRADQFDVKLSILGKHNAENVNNALTLCQELGLDMQKCVAAVATFKGIERRLERHGPKVIDDFAHSPVKIAAALEAVSDEFPAFCAYWRPHGYTPLFQLADGLIEVFSNHWKGRDGSPSRPKDKLFILPVYFAGGTVNIKVTSEQFVERLQAAGVPAEFVENYSELEKKIIEAGLPVLGMGARDPELPLFARRLATKMK